MPRANNKRKAPEPESTYQPIRKILNTGERKLVEDVGIQPKKVNRGDKSIGQDEEILPALQIQHKRGRKPSRVVNNHFDTVVSSIQNVPSHKTNGLTTRARANYLNPLPSLRADNLNVYVFGSGSMGELGLGPTSSARNVKRPRLNVHLLPSEVGVVDIAVGGMHVAAVDRLGRVWTWGVNDQGALGRDTMWTSGQEEDGGMASDDDDDEERLNPKESVPGLVEGIPDDVKIVKVACGDSITVAVTEEGKVWSWGTFRCSEGLLGFSVKQRIAFLPVLIDGLKDIVDVCCGSDHVLALTAMGKVYSWGNGQQLQLGRRVVERTRLNGLLPREFGLKKVTAIGAGSYHSFAICNDGKVLAWGLNQFGQCGIEREGVVGEDGAVIAKPTEINDLRGKDVRSISGGEHHSIAITSSGEVFGFGRLDAHQLGFSEDAIPDNALPQPKPRYLPSPTKIPGLPSMDVVFCGTHHNIGIDKQGHPWSWGFGETFQVGQGPGGEDIEIPTRIENTATRDVKMVGGGAGGQFSVLVGLPNDEKPFVNGTN